MFALQSPQAFVLFLFVFLLYISFGETFFNHLIVRISSYLKVKRLLHNSSNMHVGKIKD